MANSGCNPARVDMTELPRFYRMFKRPFDKICWKDVRSPTRRLWRNKLFYASDDELEFFKIFMKKRKIK